LAALAVLPVAFLAGAFLAAAFAFGTTPMIGVKREPAKDLFAASNVRASVVRGKGILTR
jgi:hypothetical protein